MADGQLATPKDNERPLKDAPLTKTGGSEHPDQTARSINHATEMTVIIIILVVVETNPQPHATPRQRQQYQASRPKITSTQAQSKKTRDERPRD